MTEHETEDLVRDAFRDHERLVEGGQETLVPAVRGRVAGRRRRLRVAAAGVVTLALLGGIAAGWAALPGGTAAPAGRDGELAPSPGPDLPGWRWESALGAEISVPADWAVNDYGCPMSDRPSVVRGGGPGWSCYVPESTRKELAIIGERLVSVLPPDPPTGLRLPLNRWPEREVRVDGTPATRAEGQLPDGRHEGYLTVPSRRIAITVRTHRAATTARILDSLRLVDTDRLGCPTRPDRTPGTVPGDPAGTPFVPADPASIAICHYGRDGDRLQASTELTGAAATALATAMNAAAPGRNPPPAAALCARESPPPFDVVLLIRAPAGSRTVWVTFSSCAWTGLGNGAADRRLTMSTLRMIMNPLHVGFTLMAELPD